MIKDFYRHMFEFDLTDTLLKNAYNIDIKVTYVDGGIDREICIPILKQNQLNR